MSRWGDGPWENDNAADWKEEVLGAFDFRARWLRELQQDVGANGEIIRAAIDVFSRRRDWPEEVFEEDLRLATRRLQELLLLPEIAGSAGLRESVHEQLGALESIARERL